MAESRLARELDERTHSERPKSWQPASTLPEPDKQPGYSYRWIRVSLRGQADPTNVSGKFREGWEPVRIEEQPKFKMIASGEGKFADFIEIGGLLLCKIPTEFMKQRRAHYANAQKGQAEAVENNYMKENDPRMPLFNEKRSTTSFGKGR